MKSFKSLSRKIVEYVVFTLGIITILATGMTIIQQNTASIYSNRIRQTEVMNSGIIELNSAVMSMQTNIQKLLRNKDLDSIELLIGQFDTLFILAGKHISKDISGDATVKGIFDSLEAINRQVIDYFLHAEAGRANLTYMSKSNPSFERLLGAIEVYRTRATKQSEMETVQLRQTNRRALILLILISLTFIIADLVWGLRFKKSIVTPLRQLTGMLNDIVHGNGDLTKRISINSNDELGTMAELFNLFIEQQHAIISKIAANSTMLSTTAQSLTQAAKAFAGQSQTISGQSSNVNVSTDEAVSGMNTISSSTEELSSTISTIATATEEISATINEVAKNCQKESAIAADAASLAKVNRDLIARFSSTAQKINSIVDVINDIAEQTKMLALNASIESASAGEAGRGFAVVAGEVKSLARLTAQSTLEITNQIASIRQDVAESMSASEKILSVIEEVSTISTSIASSVEEQSITVNNVVQNIAETSNVSGLIARNISENASHLSNISKSIQSMDSALNKNSSQIEQVSQNAVTLSNLSAELDQIVKKFRL